MRNRREFLEWAAVAAGPAFLAAPHTIAQDKAKSPAPTKTDSHIGNLFPFVKSQTVRGEFPLSFLRDEFKDVAAWQAPARGKLLELLHYAAAGLRPETRGRREDRLRRLRPREGLLQHHARPARAGLRAHPQEARPKRGPAVVALHDHGGFYLWGKEKTRRDRRRAPGPDEFKKTLLRRQEHRARPGPAGLRRHRHRHVLLGRAADAPGRRPGRLARTAAKHDRRATSPRSTALPAPDEQLVAPDYLTRPASPGRA